MNQEVVVDQEYTAKIMNYMQYLANKLLLFVLGETQEIVKDKEGQLQLLNCVNILAFGHKMEEYRKNDSTNEIQRMVSDLYLFLSLTQEN